MIEITIPEYNMNWSDYMIEITMEKTATVMSW